MLNQAILCEIKHFVANFNIYLSIFFWKKRRIYSIYFGMHLFKVSQTNSFFWFVFLIFIPPVLHWASAAIKAANYTEWRLPLCVVECTDVQWRTHHLLFALLLSLLTEQASGQSGFFPCHWAEPLGNSSWLSIGWRHWWAGLDHHDFCRRNGKLFRSSVSQKRTRQNSNAMPGLHPPAGGDRCWCCQPAWHQLPNGPQVVNLWPT